MAEITWKKTQRINPKSDEKLVKKRRKKLIIFNLKIRQA
jgi:hypothetical protein